MAGEFEKLLPFKWRDMHLPLTRIQFSLAHDLVEHKYWGVDGARVEATGVAPMRIAATIPLSNHIYPAKSEGWAAGKLYPDALRKFVVAFAKKSTGYVQHPEFGGIACKPERMEFELSGDKQGATELRATWVETLDDDIQTEKLWERPSEAIQSAATSLEASMTDLRKLAPELPEFREDIASFARKLSAFPDALTVLSYRQAGLVNNIIYQAKRLEQSIARAKSALTWPAIQNLQRIRAAGYELRKQFLSPNGIGLYTTREDTTLAGVVIALPKNTSVGDVIKLNPSLVRGPVVTRGTTVRYPLAA